MDDNEIIETNAAAEGRGAEDFWIFGFLVGSGTGYLPTVQSKGTTTPPRVK